MGIEFLIFAAGILLLKAEVIDQKVEPLNTQIVIEETMTEKTNE